MPQIQNAHAYQARIMMIAFIASAEMTTLIRTPIKIRLPANTLKLGMGFVKWKITYLHAISMMETAVWRLIMNGGLVNPYSVMIQTIHNVSARKK